MSIQTFQPGQQVTHADFGEGVVIAPAAEGYLRVFFPSGERQVYQEALLPVLSKAERIIANVEGSYKRLRLAWLHFEAFSLPLIENAAALTAARIDLLPHQIVLTHRIATAFPRRFLVADEVGLGKTIEAALMLRELASRGELNRVLIVVPAGLINNWHRELNEVFNLNFEVFGSEGDVTDRKSNAFAKHDRLIASVDTLKRRARVRRLMDAPSWDLVVFDEAHHLSAYRSGNKVWKTENYKLAEALRGHSRDLILLSGTPHQGDHFRFWMLIQLLNPTLFADSNEMIDQRHRLNAVVFRRTKADACTPAGSPLFARRWVHTESFTMSDEERAFYGKLREYLRDGFALAKKQGNKGRALGFVMTIFQKIAASSFAAVRSTLRKRLLMLTIHEAILRDQALDIDGHSSLMEEARKLIHEEMRLAQDAVGKSEADRILADCKLRLVKKLDEDKLSMPAASETSEIFGAEGEEMATMAVALALPEERLRIVDLLAAFPQSRETKIDKLLRGLGALWNQNSKERVVIFTTYLATVDLLKKEIETTYPGQGVVVLRGGDHGAKVAAEKRFKRTEGPKVLVCTAAGREGINLQYARVLFNFDLPWNPMDVEQRIGRIHRYGQRDTAQVYNLILSDTIEGKIFLLLNDKLLEIARTLGKMDEHGNVTEDLRSQILGQLSERLSYDQLYRDALSDPELKRTRQELEAAMANADEARKVVFELFQDLDRFSLDDYKPFSDIEESKKRLINFLKVALEQQGGGIRPLEGGQFSIVTGNGTPERIGTMDRELARADDTVDLIGIDHPLVSELLNRCRSLSPESIGTAVSDGRKKPCSLSIWLVREHVRESEQKIHLVPLAVDGTGQRVPLIEKRYPALFHRPPARSGLSIEERRHMLKSVIEPMLQRELQHRGIASETGGYSVEMVGWVEVS
ncbi:MAG: SNF2-related protein [Thermodesulfobacteriota bacterium]|nr:SNF2-related protein [Thermodesulfobacteriota bacterium]